MAAIRFQSIPRAARRTAHARTLAAAAVASCFASTLALANPAGPTVVRGQATFAANGKSLAVTNTPGAIINWQQFSIRADETTRFIQQSAASAVLNRVVGVDPSRILGALQSNGRVMLINPNGIVFGAGAQIDVAGLVASTLQLSDADFIAGRLGFGGSAGGGAAVVNHGRLSAAPGGSVVLVGSAVENRGVIHAPNGDVVLAAGSSVRVAHAGTSALQVEVTAPAERTVNLSESLYGSRGIYGGLVRNSGVINADSAVRGADGRIALKASRDVVLEAGSRVTASGEAGGGIVLEAQQGAAVVAGRVEATGSAGRGGHIAVAGTHVGLLDGASLDASGAAGGGSVLVGGDLHGAAMRDGSLELVTAQNMYVARGAQLRADALAAGDGGKVVVWADGSTRYEGAISARGGPQAGDGGMVEVSGKQTLAFHGSADTRAPRGRTGTLLLDPVDIVITSGSGDGDDPDGSSTSFAGDPSGTIGRVIGTDGTPTTLFESELQGIAATTNISLEATNSITIGDLADNNLSLLQSAGRSVSFQSASFTMVDAADRITTNGGALNITTSGGATIGSLATNGGAITLNVGGASSVAGPVIGTGTLTKQGAGTLTLSGTNTYTGTTTVSGGTLSLQGGSAIAETGAVVVGATGRLELLASETIGSLAGAVGAQVALNANTLTTGVATNTTFAGVISGAGGLTKQGTGTFTLSGANTYGGATAVNAGVLNLQHSSAAGATTGGVTVASGAALELQSGSGISVVGEVLSLAGSGPAGNGALRNISGSNSWSGTATLTGAATIQSDAGTLTLGALTGTNDLTLTGAGNGAIGGSIATDTGTLTKNGAGTWTLSGANSYTGDTTVSAGTLTLGGPERLANASRLVVTGGTFDLGGFTETLAGVQLAGGAIDNGTVISSSAFDLQSGSASAILAGGVGATKTDAAGTVTLSGLNTYTGITTINAGVLSVGTLADGNAASGIGQSSNLASNLVLSGGTLQYTGASGSTNRDFTLTAATSSTLDVSTGTLTLTGSGAGTGSLIKAGAGTLTLQGAQAYTGDTTVSAGTLALGFSDRLANTSRLVVDGGTFSLGTLNETVFGVQLLGGSITGSGGILTSTTTYDLQAGSASAILAGTQGATKTNAGGTVTLTGLNTYTGITTINAGVLSVSTIADGNAVSGIGQSSSLASNLVLGGGTLRYGGATTSTNRNFTLTALTTSGIDVALAGTNLTLEGSSTGAGSLSKTGAGTLTLQSTQAHTGNTIAAGGTLALGDNDRLADASRLVVNGGTFSLGTFNETVTGVQLLAGSITGTSGILTSITTYDLQGGSASAILTGNVGATKTNAAGTVTLSGTNTYTGATTINAGVLSVSTLENGGTPSNIGRSNSDASNLVLGGGTLQYTGATKTINRNFTLTAGTSSAIDVSEGATNLTLTGASVATSGALTKAGAGTLTLQGLNLHTGLTTVSEGTLLYGVNNALASGPVTVSGGTLDIATFTDSVGTVTLVDGSIVGTTGVLTGTSYEVHNGSISAILAGVGPLTKTTPGSVTLSGENTYSGLTTVTEGTLLLGRSDALHDDTHVLVNGGTFDIGPYSDTVAGVRLDSGTITGTSGVLTSLSDFDLRSGTVDAILNGGIGVVKTTTGNVTLSREDTFVGITRVAEGTLTVTSDKALGTLDGGTIVETGATLDVRNVNYETPEALTLNGGTLANSVGTSIFAGPVTLSANSFVSVTGTQLTLDGTIGEGPGVGLGFTKVGGGTLVLSGVGSYTGVTQIDAGTLALGDSNRLHNDSSVRVNGGTFDIGAFSDTVEGVRLDSGTITGTDGVLTSLSDFDLRSGTVSAILGGSVGAIKSTIGTVTLSRDNLYTGATAVNEGTLVVTASDALGTTDAGTTVASGATLSIVNAALGEEAVTLNGAGVGGLGALTGTGSAGLDGLVSINSASTIGVATAADTLTLGGKVEGPGALTLIGAGRLIFDGTVGETSALASLTQSLSTRLDIDGGLVRTGGDQTYHGQVTTGGATTLRTTANGANGNVLADGVLPAHVFTATAGVLTLDTGSGSATLSANALNDFGTVEVTSAGVVSLVDRNSLGIGNATLGSLFGRALAGDITVSGIVSASGSGNSVVLVASDDFVNSAGASALRTPGSGRFLVYSTNPAGDTRDGQAYDFKQYNANCVGAVPACVSGVLGSGDGFLYRVAPAPLVASLTGTASKPYDGTTDATLAPANYTFTGVLDGDTIALNGATPGVYATPNVGSGIGVSITGLSLAGASNGSATVFGYSLGGGGSASGNIGTITQAPLTLTAHSQAKTYGQTVNFAGTEFTPSGLQNGETVGAVALTSLGAPATAHVTAAPYAIVASTAGGGTFNPGNYAITYVNGALTVNPAPLTVTADSQAKGYGSPVTFAGTEFTSVGLQNGETIGTVALASLGAPATATVGNYAIVPSNAVGTFTPGDYAITYANGVLTVNPAGVALRVTANNQTKTYGQTLTFTGTEFTATGLQLGETIGSVILSSPGALASAPVSGSPYVINVGGASGGTFSPGNYTISYVDGALTVTPAPLTVRVDDVRRQPGRANPEFSATFSGFQLGETPAVLTGRLRFDTLATASSQVGRYSILPAGLGAANYSISFLEGFLTVFQNASAVDELLGQLYASLKRLSFDDFMMELLECVGSGSSVTGQAPSVKGVAANSVKKCHPGSGPKQAPPPAN